MTIIYVRVPKAQTILEVDTDRISDWEYSEALGIGLERFVNHAMAKLPKGTPKREALALAKRNIEALYQGRVAPRSNMFRNRVKQL